MELNASLEQQLIARISDRTAQIGVIGLGYVGLPLALLFTEQSFHVTGFDIDNRKVQTLSKGGSYIYRIPETEIQNAQQNGFFPTSDFSRLRDMDVIIMCVPTPLDEHHSPDMSFIENTAKSIAPHLRAGQLVILESTTYATNGRCVSGSMSRFSQEVKVTPFVCRVVDFLISPAVLIASVLLKLIRKVGVARMPVARFIFRTVGVFPIRDHYYEPLFVPSQLRGDLSIPRRLPGINWNLDTQIATVDELDTFAGELSAMPSTSFGGADQAFWYGMIRRFRPKRIIEVGSGDSTRTAMQAISRNGDNCTHFCIEPYEQPWLDDSEVHVLRERLEDVDRGLFSTLEANDILFIDSSHVIRPQGDVLTEFLEILPTLKLGVIVHVHDIFSPRHYPKSWILDDVRFWNEQYLVEAFLSFNFQWEILVASNYLRHDHPEVYRFPTNEEPGSLYIRRVR